ncbi:MAG: TonB-dependent receptor [Saprospiraceae bacterium]|nr:TonB-dependent receptor [Saprospiraceae bacterium]
MFRQIRLYCLLSCFLFLLSTLQAQDKITLSGTVSEGATGETIIGASVFVKETPSIGTATNIYGFYSLTIPITEDSVTIVFAYTGLSPQELRILPKENTELNIELAELKMEEVVVSASANTEKVNSTQMGMDEITVKEAKEIPAIFGEVDIIKVLQLKPGVQSGGEGLSGVYVRGGAGDQNLFVLDEAPVYNPNHLFGFFSTFNADAVKNVRLFKAGFPAEYGGKLSSVIDVSMREGNYKKFGLSGGLGLISSRLTFEGPIVKDKGSFIISARRTYVDIFTRLLNKANEDNADWNPIPDYSFYDINVKLNYKLGEKDRLFLSGYFGKDIFAFNQGNINFNFNWGNITGTLRWNHIISPKLFMNTAFTFSDYNYKIKNQFDQFRIELGSGIRDMNLKTDFSWFPNDKHEIKFGVNTIYHRFSVNRFNAEDEEDLFDFDVGSTFDALELAAYMSDAWTISKRLKISYGLRFSGFYNQQKFYAAPEPRVAMKYTLFKDEMHDLAMKASYSRMNQYIHLVATSGASLPTDVWYPSNPNVKPQTSDMFSLGLAWALGRHFFISVEGYYKELYGQIDFRDGAQLFVNDQLDNEFVFGRGNSYGAEFYVETKNVGLGKAGQIRGWVGYTLSWSWRQFDDIMDGQRFHPRYDRRHDASIVLSWDIAKTPLTFSATWVYGTGNAVSLPVMRFFTSDITGSNPLDFNPIYTERNGFRMPAYHRLDMGLVWRLFTKKRFKSDITFSAYNVYNRRNPFFMYIAAEFAENTPEGQFAVPERFQAKVVSLFPIIPSVTWNFKF